MATDFKYASQSDMEMYYPAFSQFDTKRQIFGWQLSAAGTNFNDTTLDLYYAANTGYITDLFFNGSKCVEETYSVASATTTLTVSSSGKGTSMGVTDVTAFAEDDLVKIEDEYMLCTAVNAGTTPDTLTATRGVGGTATVNHAVSSNIYKIIDASSDFPSATSDSDAPLFLYDSDLDLCFLIIDSKDPNDHIVEAGIDNATFFDQMLVNASMELNNLLDRRYPTPIPKYVQYDANTTYTSGTTEYDAIIIKATCYICAANLLRINSRQEDADYYHALVTNTEGSGMVDRLNKGEYKLSFEVDSDDSRGKVRTITKAGSMDIVETGGAYSGEAFDLLRITCTTAGAYGVAIVKVEYYGSDKLLGSEKTGITVKGTLQEIHGGWHCRFQGASMSQNDQWEVEVYSESRKVSNPESGAVQLTRKGYSL